MEIEVDWSSSQPMQDMGPADSRGVHPAKGRKVTATGKIGSKSYSTSTYAIIMEHLTYQ